MGHFARALADRQPPSGRRRWIFVPVDQLTDEIGPLRREAPDDLGIVVIENEWSMRRRPFHRQRIALMMTNLRHFALEQAERGVAVRYVETNAPFRIALEQLTRELGKIRMMRPAERELRCDLEPLVAAGMLEELPHEGWLTSQIDFEMSKVKGGVQRWRMDAFYRQVRRRTGILMDDDEPMGGKFSFDAENRKPWKGSPPVPIAPRFDPDEVTREVAARVGEDYADHPGTLEPGALPARRQDAETMWQWALAECLPHFGPYEDAMSSSCSGLFHTRVSSLLNLHRILPRRVVEDVAASPVPLASKEGFVRQVLGWREFVHHVHETTDGLRNITSAAPENLEQAGDGGWSRAYGRRWNAIETPEDPDGGAAPNHLGAQRELPPAFWGQPSGLACLDRVIGDVWRDGWSHHITRLMVLSNIATLLDVSPRELCDWFWAAYVDAFDWVVEPNVLAMGTFATGELMTTKPYVSGSAYIHRMSDYCVGCAFDPKNDCPITSLYWAFLDRHHERLASNPRMRIVMSAVRKRSDERLTRDREVFRHVVDRLKQGGELRPGAWSRG